MGVLCGRQAAARQASYVDTEGQCQSSQMFGDHHRAFAEAAVASWARSQYLQAEDRVGVPALVQVLVQVPVLASRGHPSVPGFDELGV